MAGLKTFDNDSGGGDGTYEAAVNWDPVGVPANGDWIKISANCVCSTDQSAAVLSGGQSEIDAGCTLTLTIGSTPSDSPSPTGPEVGTIYVQERNFQIAATGELALDGGVLRMTSTGTVIYLINYGTISGTANGGTIEASCSAANKVLYRERTGSVVGTAGARIHFDGSVGADYAGWYADTGAKDFEHIDFEQWQVKPGPNTYFCDCLYHHDDALNTAILMGYTQSSVMHSCYVYGNKRGIQGTTGGSEIRLYDCIFGEDAGAAPDENTTADIDVGGSDVTIVRCYGCDLASTTPVNIGTKASLVIVQGMNSDPEDWRVFDGTSNQYARLEAGAGAQGGAGRAVKLGSGSACTAHETLRYDRVIATIPANHGQTIDVTVYVKGTNLETCDISIDPFSLWGTATTWNETADGNWNQRTIPQYTVNTTPGDTDLPIPVVMRITDASKVWYYDTLAATVT